MRRLLMGSAFVAMAAGCAIDNPPLLPDDGQYRPSMATTPAPAAPSPDEEDAFVPGEGEISPPEIHGEPAPGLKRSKPKAKAEPQLPDVPQAAGAEETAVASVKPEPDQAPAADNPVPASKIEAPAPTQEAAALRALELINAFRTESGVAPLTYSERLSDVAQAYVIDMAARGEVSALTTDGLSVGSRLFNADYRPMIAGSVVAGGFTRFSDALKSWQESELQRERLLLPQANEFGFAIITDRQSTYVTYIEAIIAAEVTPTVPEDGS